jgi:hypothetical protein
MPVDLGYYHWSSVTPHASACVLAECCVRNLGNILFFLDSHQLSETPPTQTPGAVFPDQATVYLTAIDSGERLDYWDDVYGFRMSCMKEAVRTEAAVEVVDPWAVVATTSLVYVCACDVHGVVGTSRAICAKGLRPSPVRYSRELWRKWLFDDIFPLEERSEIGACASCSVAVLNVAVLARASCRHHHVAPCDSLSWEHSPEQ